MANLSTVDKFLQISLFGCLGGKGAVGIATDMGAGIVSRHLYGNEKKASVKVCLKDCPKAALVWLTIKRSRITWSKTNLCVLQARWQITTTGNASSRSRVSSPHLRSGLVSKETIWSVRGVSVRGMSAFASASSGGKPLYR